MGKPLLCGLLQFLLKLLDVLPCLKGRRTGHGPTHRDQKGLTQLMVHRAAATRGRGVGSEFEQSCLLYR